MDISDYKQKIENYLENYYKDKGSYNKVIYQASSYSLNIGGKRVRPLLLMLTYELYKDDIEKVIPVAGAIEMIHTYSLIHDDLPAMDNDDLRRGKPTNHKVFGEDIAILAGDALLNEAMIIMMDYSLKNGQNALKACNEITVAAGSEGMIGGQVVDVINEGKKEISEDELKYMHAKKTGELIRSSIVAGAILGEAPKDHIEKLDLFGRKLGLAFQIKDDILDVEGSAEKMGKNVNMDEELNKCNFITMYGLDNCKEQCKSLTNDCINILKDLNLKTDKLEKLTNMLLVREK